MISFIIIISLLLAIIFDTKIMLFTFPKQSCI